MSPPTGLNEEDKVVQQDTIAVLEDKQRRAAELKAQIADNEQDIDQCNEAIGRYGREFLYGVRDLEKILGVTACPLEQEQLRQLGLAPSLKSKKELRKALNLQRVLTELQLTAEQRKEQESNEPRVLEPINEMSEDEEAKKKLLLCRVCGIFENVTPKYRVPLTKEFLALRVHESPALNEIVSIIFDRAVEEPKLCELYADMCTAQEALELEDCGTFHFRTALRCRVKKACLMSNKEKAFDRIYAEVFENGFDLLGTKDELRRIEVIMFIAQLYLKGMLPLRTINFCCLETLLRPVRDLCEEKRPFGCADEEWVECAVLLLTTVGKRIYAEWKPCRQTHPLDKALAALESAKPFVSSRVRFMITNLVERSFERLADRWVPTDCVDVEEPKKVDEVGEELDEEMKERHDRRAELFLQWSTMIYPNSR